MNKGYTVRLNEDEVKQFNKLYCGLLSKYLQAALHFVLENPQYFNQIFFGVSE